MIMVFHASGMNIRINPDDCERKQNWGSSYMKPILFNWTVIVQAFPYVGANPIWQSRRA